MCGRFYITISLAAIAKRFGVQATTINYDPSFNIAPSQYVTVIINEKPWKLENQKWGLVPSWSKTPSTTYSTINARAETLDEKPTYRTLIQSKRCIIPAQGFFEWKQFNQNKTKVPYKIEHKGGLVGFAGLWDEWKSPQTNNILRTFTIITVPSNNKMKTIHLRMPVMLLPEQISRWLDEADKNILKPIDDEDTIITQISNLVNNPENNNEKLLLPERTLL